MSFIQFLNGLGDALERGDVVVIGDKQTGESPSQEVFPEVDLTNQSYDSRVCGIVSAVSVELKLQSAQETSAAEPRAKKRVKTKVPKATGKGLQPEAHSIEELDEIDRTRVEPGQIGLIVISGMFPYCKVNADIAPIKAGDLLTTSPTKGHAQKVLDPSKATGAIIGKALGSLKKGKGRIPVLVTLQ
ncbi:MAG TPA: hypothetical protein VJH03_17835 [Blastocatellia bacterium]|nr:hypothetical protein [Blastocatellia bacterium]